MFSYSYFNEKDKIKQGLKDLNENRSLGKKNRAPR